MLSFTHRSLMAAGLALASGVAASAPVALPMTAKSWQANGNANFIVREGFTQGLMQVTSDSEEGYVTLKDGAFESGTIEFDVKSASDQMPGIRFHQGPDGSADMVYVRVGPDCPVAHDCLQYLPLIHGRILWDMYPQYQAAAPFRENEWNHIRMVVSGRRLRVYVNRESVPSLSVDHLEGDLSSGTLALEGKATYANVTIDAGIVDDLDPKPTADPSATDPSYIRQWEVATPAPLNAPGEPTLADRPKAGWAPLRAEYAGLVNLARRYPPTVKLAPRQFAWLRSTIVSTGDTTRHVAIGFLREITVFVNGKAVFNGKNLYNVPGGRQNPEGRLSLENGGFDLPLHKGRNDVVVAIDANSPDMRGRYGWGFKMKLDNAQGLSVR